FAVFAAAHVARLQNVDDLVGPQARARNVGHVVQHRAVLAHRVADRQRVLVVAAVGAHHLEDALAKRPDLLPDLLARLRAEVGGAAERRRAGAGAWQQRIEAADLVDQLVGELAGRLADLALLLLGSGPRRPQQLLPEAVARILQTLNRF